ncbi:MAG: glycine--tRNA ligase subunit beta [Proteobacteria bacterium]|nr:glycine--tRNA ligase subunit beta [Pseudomonadota bacterium]HQR04976.1 glycine--tRNA ligase subunit beta [Rhodocyclaceae bacterium]
MDNKNLLVELLVEELPPKALKALGERFAQTLADSLKAQDLADAAVVTPYASPRRLAVHITDVAARAADRSLSQKLMPVSVGLDASGNATPALLKKLASLGAEVTVDALRREHDGKTDVLFFDSVASGATLAEGLQKAIEAALAALPIPKVMSYQLADGWSTVNFVRPAHKLVALHGAEVVPVGVLGLSAGRETQGHRFEATHPVVTIRDADSYAQQMESEGAVIAGFAARRAEIKKQLEVAAKKEGLTPIDDETLLDEVAALVERPNVLTCQFEQEFLDVPQECLILTMKANQKYFPLLKEGRLTNKFLIVSNIRPADPSAVIQGNERVVRPRLADAKFFYDQDRKKSLMDRIPGLDRVIYHNKLGTQGERMQRVRAVARAIGERFGGESLARQADEAAMLSKADLLTDMVGEFPELQGSMGRYYALHNKLDPAVADAIEDHYKPRFAGDQLPRGPVGTVVALADKLETLVGLFGIGSLPTGDRDPFALRRHALGVIRMLVEKKLPLDLQDLVVMTAQSFGTLLPDTSKSNGQVLQFIYERVSGYLRDLGYTTQEADAVIAARPMWGEMPRCLDAVRTFSGLPEAPALAAANKRIGNILKKAEAESATVQASVDPALLQDPAEQALHVAMQEVAPKAGALFDAGDYTASLQTLAALRVPVDRFFDEVMVNAEDPALRANRLALLRELHQAMNRVADLSRLSA